MIKIAFGKNDGFGRYDILRRNGQMEAKLGELVLRSKTYCGGRYYTIKVAGMAEFTRGTIADAKAAVRAHFETDG